MDDVERLKEYAHTIAYETMDYRRQGLSRLMVTGYAKIADVLHKAGRMGCYSEVLEEVRRGYKEAAQVNDMIDKAREELAKSH